jgi:hypothetical protein
MTTAESTAAAHPRSRSMESWRARLGVLASRGETDGPRVAEARSALSWWRTRAFLIREMGITPERAESLLDLIDQTADATHAEAVEAVAR